MLLRLPRREERAVTSRLAARFASGAGGGGTWRYLKSWRPDVSCVIPCNGLLTLFVAIDYCSVFAAIPQTTRAASGRRFSRP
jgi:hypothetical protein